MKFNEKTFKEYKDQFNYYNLIKKINPSYRLYFDQKNKRFYIVNIYKNNEICLYFTSFYRYILHDLRFSKIENFNQILRFIDNENDKIQAKCNSKNLDYTRQVLNDYHKIHNRSSKINQHDINKIIGAAQC